MRILGIRAVEGPNVFHSKEVLILTVDLENWADIGSHEIKDFHRTLFSFLPGLENHTCSLGYKGGFSERLKRGTYMAHVIEHVALEIAHLAEMENHFGKTVNIGQAGIYEVVVRYRNEAGMRVCLQAAVDLVDSILEKKSFQLEPFVQKARQVMMETKLGPTGQALFDEAVRRNIPVRRLGTGSLLELGYGKFRRRLQTAVTDRTNLIACDLVQDKQFTKNLLEEWGFSVPKGFVASSSADLDNVKNLIPGPVAVKPLDGHHGDGVSLRLETPTEIKKAFDLAREFSPKVVIEEMCEGRDFRVLVINGKFSAASERAQPMVIGDGKSTIQELVNILNQDPRRGIGHDSPLTRIEIDEISLQFLQKQNLQLNSIPAHGSSVILRSNANLSSGGTARDVTSEVHPDVRHLCERIARLVDLDICGIDIIAPNLSSAPTEQLKIIEVNAGPGLRMHLSPAIGEPRNVAGDIIDTMFPIGAQSRIPIVAVTGTNGKTTVVRIIHKILSSDAVVGLTTSDGISIGPTQILSGDMTGPQSTQIVLSDPKVEKAVLEVARGGIRRRGLGYDWSDVGVITNVREDHIGQDGIENVEDLIWIKSLVAERVKDNGTLVLNADDENSLSIRYSERLKNRNHQLLLYSCEASNLEFRKHLLSGGDGAWSESGWIYLQLQRKVHRLVSVHNLSFTMEGRATFQVSNALAAVGAAAALGATPDQILMGLMSFEPTTDNLGRLNIYKVNEGHVILDYGHNPDAISAMGGFLSQWSGHRKTAVLGLPGDRADHLLRESAFRLMTSFDQVLIRDDQDLRGRAPVEVPKMICKTILAHDPEFSCQIMDSEKDAVEQALSQIQKDDIVVIFYEHLESVMPILRQFDPTPVSNIPSINLQEEPIYDELQIPNSTYQVTS